ncbi:adenosine deaminase family protein [Streptomyces morookaense]|nr:adenosine deaminase [Streptomyces morookaense]GHF53690.1 adenosine deaminase [Streptomyces morookaense]
MTLANHRARTGRSPAGRRRRRLRTAMAAVMCTSALLAGGAAEPAAAASATDPTAATAAHLDRIRGDRDRLRAFLHDMPKGADLHNHLSGAASTELLMGFAAHDGLCIEEGSLRAVRPPCAPGARPASDAGRDREFRRRILRAWSMQDFVPGRETGHDHFFATFGKFEAATAGHTGEMLSEVADKAAAQHQFYLETMVSPDEDDVAALARTARPGDSPERLLERMTAGDGLHRLVERTRKQTDRAMAAFRTASRCNTSAPHPGCALPVRFITQVERSAPPAQVFAQLLLGFELTRQDERFVSVNLVAPEDGPVALRDYDLHMRMLESLHARYPATHITLHAGELAPGLVQPEDLRFHIRQAVLTGHAERIGHGVDARWEDDPEDLQRTLADRHVLVEVPLTSNDQILDVSGSRHPFAFYRAHHVPVALATDDEGVSRSDITTEYQRATTTYGLDYRTLKDLARTSLEYAFLPGRSLWTSRDGFTPVPQCARDLPGDRHPSAGCARLLAASPKAQAEWRQEKAFTAFERPYAAARS